MKTGYLTAHFTLAELTRTSQGMPNVPGDGPLLELMHLAKMVLEPIRELWGCPVGVNSGYRSPEVERARRKLGPADPLPSSQHMKGQAADIRPLGIPFSDAFEAVWLSDLPYDQLICERVGGAEWVHVSIAPMGRQPRRQALYTTDGRTYVPYRLGLARAPLKE